jgi:uncharacterized membrane protein
MLDNLYVLMVLVALVDFIVFSRPLHILSMVDYIIGYYIARTTNLILQLI